jgi:transposase
LDILYFLDYKLGERLPCHSTISRTRKRLPASIFESLFEKILSFYIEARMVNGQIQVIDGAFIEANASLDALERKAVLQWTLLQGESRQNVSIENIG